jgi:hypothetical protein
MREEQRHVLIRSRSCGDLAFYPACAATMDAAMQPADFWVELLSESPGEFSDTLND